MKAAHYNGQLLLLYKFIAELFIVMYLSFSHSRIARMIRQPRGNALLVGVGGTGKQSLTRLAAHICSYKCFQIELTRGYNYDSFHEDLKKLYEMAGVKGEDTVFLFTDTQVHNEIQYLSSISVHLTLFPIFFHFSNSEA